jgi:protein-S-isoprenylcysteine O-methyltransferase Ste14
MESIIAFYMRFTGKEFSVLHKILSMVPGFLIFLILSPLVIFQISSYLGSFIPLSCPRSVELVIMAGSLLFAMIFMSWALFELWTKGKGTPAPITPTHKLVITGPYRWCRNPIELGTNMYILALGIYFDSLVTGVICMFFGLVLGTAYIKLIEEKEMLMRFGKPYGEYMRNVPFMSFLPLYLLKPEKKCE